MAGRHHEQECELVGEAMADIAGIGIIVGFVGQALISLLLALWAFFLSKHGDLDVRHAEGTLEHKIDRKRLGFVSEMLVVGNDIQMLLGSSYMITTFASAKTIDLYHLHFVFDIVSFVGVSNAALMVCWTFCAHKLDNKPLTTRRRMTYFTPRHRATYIFAAMFLALTIMLCVWLDDWAPDREPGRCYHAQLITLSAATHPTADKVYVAITATWMLIAMASAIFLNARRRRWVLVSAFLQFPVHLYMALAIRSANQGKLEGEGGNENSWDFGQTTAVVLLGLAVGELYRKGREYIDFEREARRTGGKMGGYGGAFDRVASRDVEFDHIRIASYDDQVDDPRHPDARRPGFITQPDLR